MAGWSGIFVIAVNENCLGSCVVEKINNTEVFFECGPDAAAPRRKFMVHGGLSALGALTATALLQPVVALAKTGSTSTAEDIAILNAALALEFQAIAAYQLGAESNLLQKPVLDLALKFQGHHKAHADALAITIESIGGTAVSTKTLAQYGFPTDQLTSQTDVIAFAAGLEKSAASTYLHALSNFHNKHLIKGAGSILGDETMHWAILQNALGLDPVPVAFIT
jgi:hypothetical protein